MKMQQNDEMGMTLVELLAAITILGIVFVGLLSVFPQMTNSNKQTEEKLETMYLARNELANIKDGIIKLNLEDDGSQILTDRYPKDDYLVKVDYYKSSNANLKNNSGQPEGVSLNLIHIKVYKDDQTVSETFGYLKSRN